MTRVAYSPLIGRFVLVRGFFHNLVVDTAGDPITFEDQEKAEHWKLELNKRFLCSLITPLDIE